ncbi:hypothetical protein EZS27_042047, partial [termite gut metagenome]
ALLHKLRMAVGKRDEQYALSGILELDEGFFSTEMNEEDKRKPRKRGRGSQKKSKVLVMAESAPVEKEHKTELNTQLALNFQLYNNSIYNLV